MAFSGKVCLVTGAAGGLGKAIAAAFLRAGASVSICDRNAERLAQATQELTTVAAHPDRLLATVADITDEAAIEQVHQKTVATFARLDVLVNNAGIVDRMDPVGTLERDLWQKLVAVNLTAPYLFSKLAVQQMLSQQPPAGVIINIASVAGIRGSAAGAGYVATKHGLVGLTKHTAAFYNDKGIRCVAFLAGQMMTNIGDGLAAGINEEGFEVLKRGNPGATIVDVADVAEMVTFYASDSARVSNGALVSVDGGWMAY
ncbi:oxidoreductase [Capronia epimyces CBS 606.96]|uniref:3-oxoacyl-[acyl-carrier-protein] reductase n=1 Tax=Capronia epimyces CBS 606.96 TaxID=1182542 RepID=W9Z3H7_9EURO|nr:oxidoreductase [Capronia epimyces CBS 606.96]EXJ89054.1 oxidoreductase [Capronia epimyces CBS 606.96]